MGEHIGLWRYIKLSIVWCVNAFAQWVTKVLYPGIYREWREREDR